MPLARAVSLRKIVTGVDNRHADYRYTQRIHLHINLRTRLLYIAPQSPVPGNVVTELSGGHRHFAAQPARAGQACGRWRERAAWRAVGTRACSRDPASDAAAQVTHGRALARASADTRQPPSQWRSGRVRARALRRSLRIFPIGYEIWRRRGEQTRHASPSNTVTRLKRI